MELRFWPFQLSLKHRWAVASSADHKGSASIPTMLVELEDDSGVVGIGEAATTERYSQSIESIAAFLHTINPSRLSFEDVEASRAYLESLGTENSSARGALDIALLDGASKRRGVPLFEYLGLEFTEGRHLTSFTIGIDQPETIRQKVIEADAFPVLKMKVGVAGDKENLKALRSVAPHKKIRIDGNEGWKSKEVALQEIEWFAEDGGVEFVEQPMPADLSARDWIWLKERSPLPIMADESYLTAADALHCAECFHAVNIKLLKTGGVSGAYEALKAARKMGLKTMLGCMIETSVLISAAAHLADLTDYLDLDGNLLVSNDPYSGVTCSKGILSFQPYANRAGLCIRDCSGPI
ncbi:MAG: dipeptide epimerase [Verrucomicrobiota bacterium]|nr:dipeptide epimerase [Verrucomicrobiota bacterium]